MAQLTLLDMVQSILSSLNSDEVNSISDTTESMQIARIIQSKYYDILVRGALPEQTSLLQLTASGDTDRPVLMYVPSGVVRIDWIKYFDSTTATETDSSFSHDLNTDIVDIDAVGDPVPTGYKYVTGLPIDQFIDMINRFNPGDSEVDAFNFTEGGKNFTFYYKTNGQPQYYTVIENTYIIFDKYDSTLDSTLQASKTMAIGLKVTPFTLTDAFVPDLDDDKFPLLLNEAKVLAFYELKQQAHPKADQEIKRQWSSLQKDKSISNKPSYFGQLADFGRMPRTGGFSGGGWGAYKWMRQTGP